MRGCEAFGKIPKGLSLALLVLLGVLLASCDGKDGPPPPPPPPPPIRPLVVSPDLLNLPSPPVPPARTFFVLVDRSSSYWPLTKDAVETLVKTLRPEANSAPVILPGDRLIGNWLSSRPGAPAEVFLNELAPVGPPSPKPSPEPRAPSLPTLKAMPASPNCEGVTTTECKRLRNEYNRQEKQTAEEWKRQESQWEKDKESYLEKLKTRREAFDNQRREWEAERQEVARQFIDVVLAKIVSQPIVRDPIGTCISRALYNASPAFRAEPHQGGRPHKLLIFSDMEEDCPAPGQLTLKLTNVDIVVAGFHCEGVERVAKGKKPAEEVCQENEEKWSAKFKDAGATWQPFLPWVVTTPDILIPLLR